ncbi:MAG: hypothetical protein ACRD19_03695 [Terriglobia bacterium]
MLRVQRGDKKVIRLAQPSTTDAQLMERADIQKMVCNTPDAFFAELGERLFLVGEEVKPVPSVVKDSIDLLALDSDGSLVVIELKRGADKLQLLQGVAYAGMVAEWTAEQIAQEHARFRNKSLDDAKDDVEAFLDEGTGSLNQGQRVILVADEFSYEVLVAARWLKEKDIRCYRLQLAQDEKELFLSCPRVYPPLELTEAAVQRTSGSLTGWSSWPDALEYTDNSAVRDFFASELKQNEENNFGTGDLYYRIGERRRFSVSLRKKFAYVWQTGRFDSDRDFWANLLGESARVEPKNKETCISFRISNIQQFEQFKDAIAKKLTDNQFAED